MAALPLLRTVALATDALRVVSTRELIETAPVGRVVVVHTPGGGAVLDAPVVAVDLPVELLERRPLPEGLVPVVVTPYATLVAS